MAATIFMDMTGGLKMPALGLGTWTAENEPELEAALNVAFEAGYRHIDTAFSFENEAVIGRVIKRRISSGKLKRKDIFITTKLPIFGGHPDRVEHYMKESLKNLQLDYVDLYLLHFPIGIKVVGGKSRYYTPEAEDTDHIAIWKKMEEQVDAGRTKTIGLSNVNLKQIDRVFKSARIKPASLQVELHVYFQQRKLVKYCHQHNIVVIAYGPLGSPGYNKFFTSVGRPEKELPDMLNDPVIKKIAKKHKKTTAQILLRYLIQSNIVAIPKSVTSNRIKENVDVFNFSLDIVDIKSLDGLERGEKGRIFQFDFFPGLSSHPEWPLEN